MSDVSGPATVSSVSDSATESSQNSGGTQLAGELTSVQQAALRELGNGHTISDAARTAGVDRRTVSRWIHHDPKFAAAYNAWCRELLDSGRARAIAMSDAALATVANAIQSGHVGAALQVVRNLGLIQAPKIGPTDPDVLERRAALRQVRSEERLHNAEEQYGLHKPIEQIETIGERDRRDHRPMDRSPRRVRAVVGAGLAGARRASPDGPPLHPSRPAAAHARGIRRHRPPAEQEA